MKVYLDNAATTRVAPEVAQIVNEHMLNNFGNASSIHSFGREARKSLEAARKQVADLFNAQPEEIFFTSGGTESDNIALRGAVMANKGKGNHIITSKVEHHAILHTCEDLEKQGFQVTYLPVDEYGMVRVEDVEQAITDQTILISVMYGNNEVGTINPIAQIGELARGRGILFHTDAVQAAGHVPIDVVAENIDLLSMSGHKIHGPKGVGALFIRKGVRISPIMYGGSHERKMRPGTENIPGVAGLGKATELARLHMNEHIAKVGALRDKLIKGIETKIEFVKLNGHPSKRLPNNVNFSIRFIEGESLLLSLDMKGIAASSGSACTSGSLDPSHVLLAMGLDHETAHGSLRMTLSHETTEQDIDYVLEILPEIVSRLRSMSPLYNEAQLSACNRSCKSGCRAQSV